MSQKRPVVAIDGPAGAGKSSVTKAVARELGYTQVDTGALYRSVAYACQQQGIELPADPAEVTAEQAEKMGEVAQALASADRLVLRTEFSEQSALTRVTLDGKDISEAIRTQEMGQGASVVSQLPAVRDALFLIQRKLGEHGGVVLEGRDIGSVVFPDAEAKFYLTASIETRAARRQKELLEKGQEADLAQIQAEVAERDRRDMEREIAPLTQAQDAQLVDSSSMTIDEVVQLMVQRTRALEAQMRAPQQAEPGGRSYVSSKVIFVALAISLVAAAMVGWFMYTNYIRYEARALTHVPAGADLVVAVNVEQAVVYQPFREHLLALLEWPSEQELQKTAAKRTATDDARAAGGEGEPATKALERLTTLELGVDARELVYAEGKEARYLIASGLFRKDGVVAGVAEFLRERGHQVTEKQDPERALISGHGAFAVSEDGSLIWANTEQALLSAYASHPAEQLAPQVVFSLAAPADTPQFLLEVKRGAEYPSEISGAAPSRVALSGLTRGKNALFQRPGGPVAAQFDLHFDNFDALMRWLALRVRTSLANGEPRQHRDPDAPDPEISR